MSKTNHQRQFEATRDGERYRNSPPGGTGRLSVLSDHYIGAGWGGDNSNGHRGFGAAKRGAKKFVRSRTRFHEDQATRRLAEQVYTGEDD